ncbi:hypothetical protein ONS95_008876 [Cadophora gregata]|uniref:uncharacterized protein n=1 Tax=Cadophora gregata TaxID=51156 RepID=UPI0026DD6084|nr:uncharacterized protein ONS95_008876 [Cadophora gregata]KAK0123883.1 hypothetical protein ONS95_008876 [Cadophora gregata]KAK0130224.1 hypothetical protein ONS96_000747 [Cadophora gregata f. sp. sojae]
MICRFVLLAGLALVPSVLASPVSIEINRSYNGLESIDLVLSWDDAFDTGGITRPILDSSKYSLQSSSQKVNLVFYDQVGFEGNEQTLAVSNKKCTAIRKPALGSIASMTLDHHIWYCAFFAQESCKGENLAQLGSGSYADLGTAGKDFKSVKCELYSIDAQPSQKAQLSPEFFVKGLSPSQLKAMSAPAVQDQKTFVAMSTKI